MKSEKEVVKELTKTWKLLQKSMSPRSFKLLKKAYFAGGCVRSLLLETKVNDYDIFFEDYLGADIFQTKAEKDKTIWKNFKKVWKSTNTYTIVHTKTQKVFQFIRADYGYFEDVIQRFDFTMNMCSYHPKASILRILDKDSIINKKLITNKKATTPISAMLRTYRFISEGWKFSALDAMKLLALCSNIRSEEELKSNLKIEKSSSLLQDKDLVNN